MKAGKEIDLARYIDMDSFSHDNFKDNYSVAAESKSPAEEPPKASSVQEAATITLMGLGLSHTEASSFVCAALAEDKSGCPASQTIARKAYQLYISGPTNVETVASPFSGQTGYDSMKKAGMIEDELS